MRVSYRHLVRLSRVHARSCVDRDVSRLIFSYKHEETSVNKAMTPVGSSALRPPTLLFGAVAYIVNGKGLCWQQFWRDEL